MDKKKIAFLSFSALPYTSNWGSSQRVHYMANTLSEMFDVFIFAPKNTETPHFLDKEILYNSLFFENSLGRNLLKSKAPSTTSKKKNKSVIAGIKKFLVNTCINACKFVNNFLYNEPVYFMGVVASIWMYSNSKKIVDYIKKEEIQLLIISIPPWNIISISFLKRIHLLGCKIIIDYRDPWNCWNDNNGLPYIKEKQAIKLADAIFTTNINHANRLISDFNLSSEKVKVVMNGYDENLWNTIKHSIKRDDGELMVISFIGTISFNGRDSFRNPTTFMKAISESEFKDKIKFRVVGCYDQDAIDHYNSKIPFFEMIPNVSQRESFEWMMRSDVLVNFHTTRDRSSEYLIAGKIFDYYRSGKRILSINSAHSYEQQFVVDNNLGYCSENDLESIKDVLKNIYSDWQNEKFYRNVADNDIYSRGVQNKIAADFINNIL